MIIIRDILIVGTECIYANFSFSVYADVKRQKDIKEKILEKEHIPKSTKKKFVASIKVTIKINKMIIIFLQFKSEKELFQLISTTLMKWGSISVALLSQFKIMSSDDMIAILLMRYSMSYLYYQASLKK